MAVKTIDWQGGKAFAAHLKTIAGRLGNGTEVRVGFFPKDRYTTVDRRGKPRKPLFVAQVAFWNQYGTSRIPARPFFTTAINGQSANWGKDMADIAKATGYDAVKVMTLMGDSIRDDVVNSIVRWSQPPNSPRWAAIKKFNKPLVDEGTMQRSVGSEVTSK